MPEPEYIWQKQCYGPSDDAEPLRANGGDQRAKVRKKRQPVTDSAVARAFAERHQGGLRYVSFWSRWLRFDNTRWAADQTRHAFDLVHQFCRDLARDRGAAARKTLEAAKKISAVHNLAQADRRIAAEPDLWDSDIYLLNEEEPPS